MTLTDPLANALTIIRNGLQQGKKIVSFPYSKFKWNVCRKLEGESYIDKADVKENNIIIYLKKKIQELKKISTSSRFVYVKAEEIKKKCRYGLYLISTSKGLLTNREALKEKQGGKIILFIV